MTAPLLVFQVVQPADETTLRRPRVHHGVPLQHPTVLRQLRVPLGGTLRRYRPVPQHVPRDVRHTLVLRRVRRWSVHSAAVCGASIDPRLHELSARAGYTVSVGLTQAYFK